MQRARRACRKWPSEQIGVVEKANQEQREDTMQAGTVLMAGALLAFASTAVLAQAPKAGVPQFQVDALWPKDLPNNWLLGQVSGIIHRSQQQCLDREPAGLAQQARARGRAEAAGSEMLRG